MTRRSLTMCVAILLLSACGGDRRDEPGTQADAGVNPSPPTKPSSSPPAPTGSVPPAPVNIENPVYTKSFPDPFVLKVVNTWHAYATSASGKHIPHLVSTDLQHWQLVGDALPNINGAWIDSNDPQPWAPSVARIDTNHFVLYYAPHLKGTEGRHCVGRALADDPAGPFVDDFDGPLYCDDTPGHGYWSLDPTSFVDDGKRYLLWRQDNGSNGGSHVAIRPLRADGQNFEQGSNLQLLVDHDPGSWEDNPTLGKLIENPAMIRRGADYYVFYAGNSWQTASYAIGYAVCSSPLGPCVKKTTNAPWFASNGNMQGPGGLDFFEGPDGKSWAAWHAWYGAVGPGNGTRQMFVGAFDIGANGTPSITQGVVPK